MTEPGLDLHEWETRWQELQDLAAEEPEETLPELTRLIHEALVERNFQLDEPVTVEGEEPEIVKLFQSARETAAFAEKGEADSEDVASAIEDLRSVYEYLVENRAPP